MQERQEPVQSVAEGPVGPYGLVTEDLVFVEGPLMVVGLAVVPGPLILILQPPLMLSVNVPVVLAVDQLLYIEGPMMLSLDLQLLAVQIVPLSTNPADPMKLVVVRVRSELD
jgi:hypothetical protein